MSDYDAECLTAIEREAIEAIRRLGYEADQIGDLQVYVFDGDIAYSGSRWDFTYRLLTGDQGPIPSPRCIESSGSAKVFEPVEICVTDPITRPHDPDVDLAWAGYLLLACCRYFRTRTDANATEYLVLGQAIAKLQMALRFPEIRSDVVNEFLPLAALGEHRRKDLKAFGKRRGEELHEEREPEWEKWQDEAGRQTKADPSLSTRGKKSELARRVQKSLDLKESVRTIRRRL